MAFLHGFLVNTDMPHQTWPLTAATTLHSTQHDRVDLIPTRRHAPRNGRDGHLA